MEQVDDTQEPGQGEQTDAAVEANGYTFAVTGATVDDNGLGSATFTLSNPDGLAGTIDESGGFVATDGSASIDAVRLRVGSDELDGRPNLRFTVDEAASTETELTGTVHFDTRAQADVADGLFCGIYWHEGTDAPESSANVSQPLAVEAAHAHDYVDDAAVARVSPVGVVLATGVNTDEGQFIDSLVTLRMADGSEVVVYGAEGAVSATQSMRQDGSSSYTFGSPVNPDEVKGVTVQGTLLGAGGSEEPMTYNLTPGA